MERMCRVSQLCDKTWLDPKMDSMFRAAAAAKKANSHQKESGFRCFSQNLWSSTGAPNDDVTYLLTYLTSRCPILASPFLRHQCFFHNIMFPKYIKKKTISTTSWITSQKHSNNNFTLQVTVEELDTILYVDCTKLGVLSQTTINSLGDLAERVLFRSPSRNLASFQDQTICLFLTPKFVRGAQVHLWLSDPPSALGTWIMLRKRPGPHSAAPGGN